MGKKKVKSNRTLFVKKKKSKPKPMKKKIIQRQKKVKAFFTTHNPKLYFGKHMKKVVQQIYTVSGRVKGKIAESPIVQDNPFNKEFYQDRCCIQ